MSRLCRLLTLKLKDTGMDPDLIPGFIRTLAVSVANGRPRDLVQVNRRLKYLGWDEYELDYHALELALACFEEEKMVEYQYRSGCWYAQRFNLCSSGSS